MKILWGKRYRQLLETEKRHRELISKLNTTIVLGVYSGGKLDGSRVMASFMVESISVPSFSDMSETDNLLTIETYERRSLSAVFEYQSGNTKGIDKLI